MIAGGGLAAAATAIRLASLGIRPRLLIRGLEPLPGIEATPLRTSHLLQVLGANDVLAAAGAVECPGMAHDWSGRAGHVASRVWHVDRGRLARELLEVAVSRGATVELVHRLPPVQAVGSPPSITAVDATGRAAAWSRPVVGARDGREVAWQFEGAGQEPAAGRLTRGSRWWAYCLGHPQATWASVVTPSGPIGSDTLAEAIASLEMDARRLTSRGRRRANVQLAASAVAGHRISVGDAALAHYPLAGAGIRFALASAIAAAHVIATVASEPGLRDTAVDYYEGMVVTEHEHHLSMMARLVGHRKDTVASEPSRSPGEGLPPVVRFAAELVTTSLSVDGRVTTGPALRLPDGGSARWLGSFDLLQLADLAQQPTPRVLLAARLHGSGLDPSAARAVIEWAIRHKILE